MFSKKDYAIFEQYVAIVSVSRIGVLGFRDLRNYFFTRMRVSDERVVSPVMFLAEGQHMLQCRAVS